MITIIIRDEQILDTLVIKVDDDIDALGLKNLIMNTLASHHIEFKERE